MKPYLSTEVVEALNTIRKFTKQQKSSRTKAARWRDSDQFTDSPVASDERKRYYAVNLAGLRHVLEGNDINMQNGETIKGLKVA